MLTAERQHVNFCLFLCIILIFSAFVYGQDHVIRVKTDLITIPVTVLDRDGRYVTNLKEENFQIIENGSEQQVAFFEPVDQPFTVFLLLDRSSSMTEHLAQLNNAANVFVNQLRPNDQVIVASFANDVAVLIKRASAGDVERDIKVQRRPGDSHTMLYDAVDFSLNKMKKIRGRKAIIVFSDGAGDGVFASFKGNLRKAEEGDSLIYTIQFDTFPRAISPQVSPKVFHQRINTANAYMKMLPTVTGGRSYRIDDISNLEATFNAIAQELRQQYRLGYYPEVPGTTGERREIKVKVNITGAAIRARDSYIVGANKK